MRNETKVTLLSVLVDSVITWHAMTGSPVNTGILAIRLALFTVAEVLVMVGRPLSKATN